MHPIPQTVLVVLGPTASGKTNFAIEQALLCKNGAEIISADSRQIYKDLDLGTGKVTTEEMRGVKHHMIDICECTDTFSVATFKQKALPILEDILQKGKTPIICGGTGQYIDALIYKETIPEIPPNTSFRDSIDHLSNEVLFERLKEKDRERANTIDKHNRVRLVRALEILETHSKVPILPTPTLRYPTTIYIMDPSRELLKKRIHIRLKKRFEFGMLDEAKQLLERGFTGNDMRRFGLEYKWMYEYLTNTINYEEMLTKLETDIWHYARRQLTWNKKYKDIAKYIPVTE
jgi:tRNA dimethylallyltransferase